MKKFVDGGMFLQMKITLIIYQKKNTSTKRTNGGSISISRVLTPYHWENVLIPSKRCLPWNVYTKKLEKNHSCPLIPTSTNNGSRHRVRHLHGGNGKIPGGLLKIQKVKEEASKVLGMNGETRYWHYFGESLRRWLSRIQVILFQIDRLQLTAVYCNRRGL